MLGKISIRNIPAQIWNALETMATQNDRSIEAETRVAIRQWCEPLLVQHEQSVRRSEIAGRLRAVLDQVNSAMPGQSINASRLAEQIGETHAEATENWLLGRVEPSFSQLSAIAALLGANPQWLKHGNGQMFPIETHRLPQAAKEAVSWLLAWNPGDKATPKVANIHLVREQSNDGRLLVVKQMENGHCKTFSTQFHVSEVIGAGGESDLCHLWLTLELLYKNYTRLNLNVNSYLLKPSLFSELTSGKVHPLSILRNEPNSAWWEDIWHAEMYNKNEYWPGWQSLCRRIDNSIASRKHVREERELIKRTYVNSDGSSSVFMPALDQTGELTEGAQK